MHWVVYAWPKLLLARLSIIQVCFPVFLTRHFLSLPTGSCPRFSLFLTTSLSNYSILPPSRGHLLAPSQMRGSQSLPTLCHSLCLQNIFIYITFLTSIGFENRFSRAVQGHYLCACWKSCVVPEKWWYKLHYIITGNHWEVTVLADGKDMGIFWNHQSTLSLWWFGKCWKLC